MVNVEGTSFGGSVQVYDRETKKAITLGEIELTGFSNEGKRPVLRGRVIVDNRVYQVSLWERNGGK